MVYQVGICSAVFDIELVAEEKEDVSETVEMLSFMKKRSCCDEVCRFEVKMSMYIGIVRSVRTSGRMRTRMGRSRAIVRRELRKMRPMRGHARRGVTSLAEVVLHCEPEARVLMRRNALREIGRRGVAVVLGLGRCKGCAK